MEKNNIEGKSQTTLNVLWLAMAQSHIIFGIIAHFVISKSSTGVFDLTSTYVLFGIAIACGLSAWFMNKKAAHLAQDRVRENGEKPQALDKAFPVYILSWVICETISINGLLMVILLGPKALSTASILFVLGLGLHLLLKPRFK